MDDFIYFDNNSTTEIDSRVLDAMLPFFQNKYSNAASLHQFGVENAKAVEEARKKVADLCGASSSDIIFTSGATESVNLAIKEFALANQAKGKHIITLQSEHKAVLDSCKYLESIGFEISYLPVQSDGLLPLLDLEKELREDTILVSVMYSNNETGVIQPLKSISKIVHKAGKTLFTDATQAVGKIPINVYDLNIDMMAFSGHKFYGPKGIGGLFIRNLKQNKLTIQAQMHGGGQELGLRSGTLNVPLIIGLGKACEIANVEMKEQSITVKLLRDKLERNLLMYPGAYVNGSSNSRIFNVTNICFPGNDANVLLGRLKNIIASNGSACSSAILEPSHVLKSLGLSDDDALSSIRFSLSKFNTEAEVYVASQKLLELLTNSEKYYA